MINVETLNSLEPNVEMSYVACKQDISTSPLIAVNIQRSDLDDTQKTVYDNFMGLLGQTRENKILNSPCMLSINRGTSLTIADGLTQQDYTVDFDVTQQEYVDAFVQLVVNLYE